MGWDQWADHCWVPDGAWINFTWRWLAGILMLEDIRASHSQTSLINRMWLNLPNLCPQIDDFKLQTGGFNYMAGPQCIRIQVVRVVRMKDSWFLAGQNNFSPWRICQAKNSPLSTGGNIAFAGGTDNCDRLGQHHLVAGMGMKIAGAHERGLTGMGVDPAEDHEVGTAVNVIEKVGLVGHLAGVGGGSLTWNDQL